jgi:hypothetical protein
VAVSADCEILLVLPNSLFSKIGNII